MQNPVCPVAIELVQRAAAIALEVREQQLAATVPPSSLEDRISAVLSGVNRPLPFAELRARCRVRNASLYTHLAALTAAGRLIKSAEGYCLAK